MTYEGGVTSVNVVSAVSLKTRVIGAEMEHPGQSWYRNQDLLLFVSISLSACRLQQLRVLSTQLTFLHFSE